MRVVTIVQARYGSTRLPGKVLLPLGRARVLDEVIRRCDAIPTSDLTCVAVPESRDSDAVADLAQAAGAVVVRGPEHDVLARYGLAAERTGADIILRVTSDCPLLDPDVAAQVLAVRARESADYAGNNLPPRGWPYGLDCEAMTRDALDRAVASATTPYAREHVSPWLTDTEGNRLAWAIGPGGPAATMRWTLDFQEDYDFLHAVFARLDPGVIPGWTEVVALIDGTPELQVLHDRARKRAAAHT